MAPPCCNCYFRKLRALYVNIPRVHRVRAYFNTRFKQPYSTDPKPRPIDKHYILSKVCDREEYDTNNYSFFSTLI